MVKTTAAGFFGISLLVLGSVGSCDSGTAGMSDAAGTSDAAGATDATGATSDAGATDATGATDGAGTAGSGGTAGPATPLAFCDALNVQFCRLEFLCRDSTMRDPLDGASAEECVANNAPICPQFDCVGYDATVAKVCLDDLASATCAQFGSIGQLPSCNAACN